jgi:2-polyprenyl-3-methyl-5-hydroxy-6-metoxy-1,4-benzoquinol methylase
VIGFSFGDIQRRSYKILIEPLKKVPRKGGIKPKFMTVSCPLCDSAAAIEQNTILFDHIETEYRRRFDITLDNKITDQPPKLIRRYRCADCELRFFLPSVIGSEDLYSALGDFDWYLQQNKWEFERALIDIEPHDRVLEIGCGDGHFLQHLKDHEITDVIGIDIDSSALNRALDNGHEVYQSNVESFEADKKFDVVCSFQVLEHVADPYTFLKSSLSLLRPGGTLIFAVPNSSGFLATVRFPLLNMPPHHQTRWDPEVVRNLTSIFSVDVQSLECGPLTEDHQRWYVREQFLATISKLIGNQFVESVDCTPANKVLSALARFGYGPALSLSGRLKEVDGHTMYAKIKHI